MHLLVLSPSINQITSHWGQVLDAYWLCSQLGPLWGFQEYCMHMVVQVTGLGWSGKQAVGTPSAWGVLAVTHQRN